MGPNRGERTTTPKTFERDRAAQLELSASTRMPAFQQKTPVSQDFTCDIPKWNLACTYHTRLQVDFLFLDVYEFWGSLQIQPFLRLPR